MKYFSFPSDFKSETVDRIHELNNTYEDRKVVETYGQLTTGALLNSGRVTEALPQVGLKALESYVRYLEDRGMVFNYTLNPACFGNFEFSEDGINQINDLLSKLYSIGIKWLTITSPSLLELVMASGLDFKIKASAICEITSPAKVLFYKKLGVERVVVDPDITRRFDILKNISKVFGDGVEIIINNVCYKNCAYKMFHYNHEAHCTLQNNTQTIKDYYFNRCSMQKAGDFKNAIRLNWIRPEDLNFYYESGIRFYKLQGRQNVLQSDIVRTIEHYFNESFDGNLFDLITIFAQYNAFQPYIDNRKLDGFLHKFYSDPAFCTDVCDSCGYCGGYAQKSMDRMKTDELNRNALRFFEEYDGYTKVINKKSRLKSVNKAVIESGHDYDFEL